MPFLPSGCPEALKSDLFMVKTGENSSFYLFGFKYLKAMIKLKDQNQNLRSKNIKIEDKPNHDDNTLSKN